MKVLNYLLLLSMIVVLPACKPWDWFKNKTDSVNQEGTKVASETVVTIDGAPAVTSDEVEQNFQKFVKAMSMFSPDALKGKDQETLFKESLDLLIAPKLLLKWIKESGVDKKSEYIEKAKKAHEMVDMQLASEELMNVLNKEITPISDDQAKLYYDQNKARFTAKGKTISFAEVKDKIKAAFGQEKFHEALQKKLADLKSQYKVVISPEYLEKRKKEQEAAAAAEMAKKEAVKVPEKKEAVKVAEKKENVVAPAKQEMKEPAKEAAKATA